VLEAMKHPTEDHSLFCIDLLSNVVNNYAFGLLDVLCSFSSSLDFSFSNISVSILDKRENDKTGDIEDALSLFDTSVASECDAEVAEITLGSKMLPSVEHSPTLELKPLPSHLKYAYLERDGKLLVIISALLIDEQEQRLLQGIKDHKRAIGWTLADIPGISPSFCMHRILLEEDVKPVRQPQRRLNPQLMEVVKKEVTKLLQAGIIYHISNSTWVSPVHMVPKKSRITMVKNEKNELIPTRIQNSWRVCIDYRRLNQATRKDHFPLPFMDQMLDRLAGKSH